MSTTRTAALLVAAGRGTRFGGPVPKQYQELGGEMILTRSLKAMLASGRVTQVICAIDPSARDLYDAAVAPLDDPRLLTPVGGGDSRAASVLNALRALADHAPDRVLIHDAARPFLPVALIDQLADAKDGAILAEVVVDALWREDNAHADTPVPRAGLWRAQTPQAFPFQAILAAHEADAGSETPALDDAETFRRAGHPVRLIPGHPDNFKITTQADMTRAGRLIAAGDLGPVDSGWVGGGGGGPEGTRRNQTTPYGGEQETPMEIRTGHGFDVHRFAPGDHVWLCGVQIAHDKRLDGHSDADVGLHALADAIYGALAEGDIGTHFPPTDPQWKGTESHVFLAHAASLIARRGGRLVNADVTLLCEAPKIKPHAGPMRARMAEILGTTPDRVSVKATTMERMGFVGREEGMGCIATATLELPR